MKKMICILLSVVSAITFSACTEEQVIPTTETAGGGHASDPA